MIRLWAMTEKLFTTQQRDKFGYGAGNYNHKQLYGSSSYVKDISFKLRRQA
jgi:hypothetical protein